MITIVAQSIVGPLFFMIMGWSRRVANSETGVWSVWIWMNSNHVVAQWTVDGFYWRRDRYSLGIRSEWILGDILIRMERSPGGAPPGAPNTVR